MLLTIAVAVLAAHAPCPVTLPPDPPFVPPAPYSAQPTGGFWYGTPRLWTLLTGTRWQFRRKNSGYFEKVVWFWEGLSLADWRSGRGPTLLITATRLDREASQVTARATLTYREQDWKAFLLAGIDIPKAGCWEISAQRDEDVVRYVVRVGSR
jgi:hypothetical protein